MLKYKDALPNIKKAKKLHLMEIKKQLKAEKVLHDARMEELSKEIDARLTDADFVAGINTLNVKLPNATYHELSCLVELYKDAGWSVAIAFDQTVILTGDGFELFKWFPQYKTKNTYYLYFYLRLYE